MGNKPSLPANEAIYHAAKNGRAAELDMLLRNAPPEMRPENLLEWQDEDGRTALIAAAAKNQLECVELLLRYRANVQHMSRRREGGTALHEAVFRQCNRRIVDSLLKYGASPFMENVSRFTAMDYAIVRRDAGMIRRLERCGYFCQYMQTRVRKNFGLSKSWTTMWVAIFPRYGCPLRPQQPIRRLMLIYHDARSFDPISKLFLDGSSVRQVIGDNGQPQALLALHRTHIEPKQLAVNKDSAGQWLVNFRAFDQNPAHVPNLIQAINAQHDIGVRAAEGESDEAFARRIGGGGSEDRPATSHSHPHQPSSTTTSVFTATPSIQPDKSHAANTTVPAPNAEEGADDYEAASAPPLPPEYYGSAGQGSSSVPAEPTFDQLGRDSNELGDDNLCVVCLDRPKTVGLAHGTSMHRCVCQECAIALQKSGQNLCPVCRQPVEHVITNFFY